MKHLVDPCRWLAIVPFFFFFFFLFPLSLSAFHATHPFLHLPTPSSVHRIAFLSSSKASKKEIVEFQQPQQQQQQQQYQQYQDDDDDDDYDDTINRRFQLENQVSKSLRWDDDALEVVRHYTETAIQHRGQPRCIQALQVLSARCYERQPFRFSMQDDEDKDDEDDEDDEQQQPPPNKEQRDTSRSIISKISNLLPFDVTTAFLQEVQRMEHNGWLSTNPDSVDGLPSLHINLMSGGKSVVPAANNNNNNNNNNAEDDLNDLERGIVKLQAMIEPYIHDTLLPEVNRLLNSTSIQVSDVFLRRYGQDIGGGGGDDDGGSTLSRNSLSAHYDVLSRVTSVIALDNVAALGTNGLYTTYQSSPQQNSPWSNKNNNNKPTTGTMTGGKTSNHASLRRFFPLAKGDAVVHTWDVLHGVDVEPGLERTSLIVWFTTEEEQRRQEEEEEQKQNNKAATITVSSWLTNHPHLEEDDVAQFVLATALSSSSPASNDHDDHHVLAEKQNRLYLQSAAQGNTFALNSMGCLCEEGNFSSEMIQESLEVLESLRPLAMLPDPIRCYYCGGEDTDNDNNSSMQLLLLLEMARRFWFEGSVRGNPLAQQALADSLMLHESTTPSSLARSRNSPEKTVEDSRLLAAVLFALASQQGKEDALESLERVVEMDLSTRTIQSEEDFLASPVVQIAQAI